MSDRLQAFFDAKGMDAYQSLYKLDGTLLGGGQVTGLIATNAVASLAATNPSAKAFVKALWACPIPSGKERYYDGTLYLLSMLHVSGRFRPWPPR